MSDPGGEKRKNLGDNHESPDFTFKLSLRLPIKITVLSVILHWITSFLAGKEVGPSTLLGLTEAEIEQRQCRARASADTTKLS